MTVAAGVEGSSPLLNIVIFLVFVAITLAIVVRVSRRATSGASDFYTAGGGFTGQQNGVAISGDYLSAASFLGIAGAIALYGYDGFLYSIGFLVAWLVALLLVAELLRNTGRFTMGDVLAFRMRQRPVRAAAAVSTLVVSFFYLLAQMAGAGGLVALLLDVTSKAGQSLVIAVWVLATYGFNFSALLGDAVAKGGTAGAKLLAPGAQYGKSGLTKLDFISLALALVLGTAGLPHVLMRFYTVPSAKEARRSVQWAIGLIGVFYLFTLVLGYGAGALVGPAAINAAPGKANSAAPLLAYALGGTVLLGIIASANLPTILYSLFWKRFNTSGALWSIYGGLAITIVLIVFSPVVSGKKDAEGHLTASMIQGVDFHWFPLDNPGIVSIPLSFLLGYLGTVLSKDKADPALYAEMEVRSLTGIGAVKHTVH